MKPNEMIDIIGATKEVPTASAFIQQRSKIKPEAFMTIFEGFTGEIFALLKEDLPFLEIDGSKIQIATSPDDIDAFFPGTNGQAPYNLLHLNELYNLKYHIYENALIQKARNANEHKALVEMVDRFEIPKAVVIADRGYESYNNLAHIQEKGWFFLFRIKDGKQGIKQGFTLPDRDSFDENFCLNLTRKQTNKRSFQR